MKTLPLLALVLVGCGPASFELGPGSEPTALPVAIAPGSAADSGDSGPGDIGASNTPDVSIEIDGDLSPVDSGTDTYVPALDTGVMATDARAEIVFPSSSDTWTTKYGPGRFALVGDAVRGTRVLSGGQIKGSATLATNGDGYAGHQIKVALHIDGAKIAEDIAYPAQKPRFSFVLGAPMSPGAHTFEFRVVAVYACYSSTCDGGYFEVAPGATVINLEGP